MVDAEKQLFNGDEGGGGGGTPMSDIKTLFSVFKTKRTMVFAYGCMFTFVVFTAFIAFNPSANSSSPWFNNIFSTSSSTLDSTDGARSQNQFSFFSYFFPNSSQPQPTLETNPNITRSINTTSTGNLTVLKSPPTEPKSNLSVVLSPHPSSLSPPPPPPSSVEKNRVSNYTASLPPPPPPSSVEKNGVSNYTASSLKNRNGTNTTTTTTSVNSTSTKEKSKEKIEGLLNSLMKCDIFDGNWVKDNSYPLYPPGSCPLIDEQFNCILNGRPDVDFQKMRWKPKGCDLPRLKGKDMLELLRNQRLVFVGDSLNRNMWESLICTLRNSVEDKSKVFEASGRREFRTEGFYSFIFKDYNCSIEFFRSPFLVQEWEMPDTNGTKKETLRLDLVEPSSSKYKDADIIVFNTGHWWTHDKTSKGKDYYQVGNHVIGSLNVVEAFHQALMTWAKWVDANIDPKKSLVLFRGYSASHFSGGQWNSGGSCDHETEPIKNETYLSAYPPKMRVLESVLRDMKTPVSYLNITRMTDYRKDAHPSVYRKQHLSLEERKSPLRYQDCSHWCLPGVPDYWNELLYAQILIKQKERQLQQQQEKQQQQKPQQQEQRQPKEKKQTQEKQQQQQQQQQHQQQEKKQA